MDSAKQVHIGPKYSFFGLHFLAKFLTSSTIKRALYIFYDSILNNPDVIYYLLLELAYKSIHPSNVMSLARYREITAVHGNQSVAQQPLKLANERKTL